MVYLSALRPAPAGTPVKPFKACVPSCMRVVVKYLPQLADERRRRCLFVASDRATRWVYVTLKPNKSARSANAFLKTLAKAAPFCITTLLADNYKEFDDRFAAFRERSPTGQHAFD